MGFAYYSQLFRDAVINKNGNVNSGSKKQRAAGPDHGYQPKRKEHYKPSVYVRELTAHGLKPVPPAGSDAPDA